MEKEVIRKKHTVWTVSGRYNIKLRSILLDECEQDAFSQLRLIVIGGLYRYIPQVYIDDYLLRVANLGASTKYYLEVLFCLAQEYVIPKLSKHRRYLSIIEDTDMNEIYNQIKDNKINIERDKLRFTYVAYKAGKDYSKFDTDMQVVNTIRRANQVKNAYEFMELLYQIFEMYLGGIPNKYESKISKDSSDDEVPFNAEVLKKLASNIYEDDAEAEVFAAEFNHNIMEEEIEQQLEAVDELLLFSSHADSRVMFDKILSNYGPSIFSDRQKIELERTLSKGNHKGCKIHYSKEFMYKSKGYKKEYIQEQYDANLRFYEENINLNEMNINNLITIIREKILVDLDEAYYNLDRGIIDRRKLFRYVVLNDNKIFMKKYKDDLGSIALTILVDSSGSQLSQQKHVATWAYILSQAFTMCGIPTRVVGFNNLFDYTVFREYRDFNDPISKNKDVFYFTAEGSNRDGMAINTVAHMMKSRPETKKLILVLSDGKPNDVRIGVASHMVSGHDTSEYTGIKAIEDTAKIVRRCNADGVKVAGVYTGEREDIASQKLIYGNMFAYVPDFKYMGKVIGKIVEDIIQKDNN